MAGRPAVRGATEVYVSVGAGNDTPRRKVAPRLGIVVNRSPESALPTDLGPFGLVRRPGSDMDHRRR